MEEMRPYTVVSRTGYGRISCRVIRQKQSPENTVKEESVCGRNLCKNRKVFTSYGQNLKFEIHMDIFRKNFCGSLILQ